MNNKCVSSECISKRIMNGEIRFLNKVAVRRLQREEHTSTGRVVSKKCEAYGRG